MSTLKGRVFGAYKELIRTQNKVFKHDNRAKKIGYSETRKKFLDNKAEINPENIEKMLADAEATRVYLEKHIIQGVQNQRGNFELRVTKDHHTTQEITPSFNIQ